MHLEQAEGVRRQVGIEQQKIKRPFCPEVGRVSRRRPGIATTDLETLLPGDRLGNPTVKQTGARISRRLGSRSRVDRLKLFAVFMLRGHDPGVPLAARNHIA